MKKISERKAILIASLISYATFAVNILVTIFYTPFMLESLGDVQYGIRSFALSFASYTSLLGLGISSSYLRFANLALKKDGQDGVKRINGIFYKIYSIIGALAILAGGILVLLFATNIIPLNGYSASEKSTIITVVALSFIQSGITFATCVFPLIVMYNKRFIFRNTMFLLSTIISHAVWAIILVINSMDPGDKVIWLSATGLFVELLFHLINFIFIKGVLHSKADFKSRPEDKGLLKEILVFSLFSFLVTVTVTLNASTDKIILGFMEKDAVTIYALSVVFIGYLETAANTVSVLFDPRINESAVNGNTADVQHVFDTVSFICTLLLSFIVFGFVSCGKQFICGWIGADKGEVFVYTIPLMFSCIFIYPQKFSLQIQRANNKHKFSALIYFSSFVINIGISIGLCVLFKQLLNAPIWGCIAGTLFAYVVETIGMSIYNSRVLKLKQSKMWLQTIINVVVSAIAAAAIWLLFKYVINLSEQTYLVQCIIEGLSYVVLFALLQFAVNFKNIKNFLQTFKHRKDKPVNEAQEKETV